MNTSGLRNEDALSQALQSSSDSGGRSTTQAVRGTAASNADNADTADNLNAPQRQVEGEPLGGGRTTNDGQSRDRGRRRRRSNNKSGAVDARVEAHRHAGLRPNTDGGGAKSKRLASRVRNADVQENSTLGMQNIGGATDNPRNRPHAPITGRPAGARPRRRDRGGGAESRPRPRNSARREPRSIDQSLDSLKLFSRTNLGRRLNSRGTADAAQADVHFVNIESEDVLPGQSVTHHGSTGLHGSLHHSANPHANAFAVSSTAGRVHAGSEDGVIADEEALTVQGHAPNGRQYRGGGPGSSLPTGGPTGASAATFFQRNEPVEMLGGRVQAEPTTAFEIPELPMGQSLTIRVLSTWGDNFYCGLNGLDFFDHTGHPITLADPEAQIFAAPSSVDADDPRVPSNLVDGVQNSMDELHSWLAPFSHEEGVDHCVFVEFDEPVRLAMLRIWNYNASRVHSQRGVRYVEIMLDGNKIFKGEICQASGAVDDPQSNCECILFSTNESILALIEHYDTAWPSSRPSSGASPGLLSAGVPSSAAIAAGATATATVAEPVSTKTRVTASTGAESAADEYGLGSTGRAATGSQDVVAASRSTARLERAPTGEAADEQMMHLQLILHSSLPTSVRPSTSHERRHAPTAADRAAASSAHIWADSVLGAEESGTKTAVPSGAAGVGVSSDSDEDDISSASGDAGDNNFSGGEHSLGQSLDEVGMKRLQTDLAATANFSGLRDSTASGRNVVRGAGRTQDSLNRTTAGRMDEHMHFARPSTSVGQRPVRPVCARAFRITLRGNWGGENGYIGLSGLRLLDEHFRPLDVSPEMLSLVLADPVGGAGVAGGGAVRGGGPRVDDEMSDFHQSFDSNFYHSNSTTSSSQDEVGFATQTLFRLVTEPHNTRLAEHMWMCPTQASATASQQLNASMDLSASVGSLNLNVPQRRGLVEASVLITLPQEQVCAGFRVWNYNDAGEDSEASCYGARRFVVHADGELVTPAQGVLLRKGPGNDAFDFGQFVPIAPQLERGAPHHRGATTNASPGRKASSPSRSTAGAQSSRSPVPSLSATVGNGSTTNASATSLCVQATEKPYTPRDGTEPRPNRQQSNNRQSLSPPASATSSGSPSQRIPVETSTPSGSSSETRPHQPHTSCSSPAEASSSTPPQGELVQSVLSPLAGNSDGDDSSSSLSRTMPKAAEARVASSLAFSAVGLPAVCLTPQQYETPIHPCGCMMKFVLHSTHGDMHYIGLTGIELFDSTGSVVQVQPDQVQAVPRDINGLAGRSSVEWDVRTPDKLVDRATDTMWLAPFVGGVAAASVNKRSPALSAMAMSMSGNLSGISTNVVFVMLDEPVAISCCRIWNYAKTPDRGVKELEIYMDDELIYHGQLLSATDTGVDGALAPGDAVNYTDLRHQSVLFTNDPAITERELPHIVSEVDEDVLFTDDGVLLPQEDDPAGTSGDAPTLADGDNAGVEPVRPHTSHRGGSTRSRQSAAAPRRG